MRTFCGIFLLIFAASNFVAGLFYLLSAFGTSGMLSMMGALMEVMEDPLSTLAEIDHFATYASILLTVYGATLLIGSFVIFSGGVSLLSQTRPMLVLFAAVFCLSVSAISMSVYGPGIGNGTGVIIALLSTWQAFVLKKAALSSDKSKSHVYSTPEKILFIGLIFSLIALISFTALYGMTEMRKSIDNSVREAVQNAQIQVTSSSTTTTQQTSTPITPPSVARSAYIDEPVKDSVQGIVGGVEFALQQATINKDVLTLRQGGEAFAGQSIAILLFNDHQIPESKQYHVRATTPGASSPHIHIISLVGASNAFPVSTALTNNYDMTLEFGEIKNDKLPGKIKLSIKHKNNTHIEGFFEATVLP